MDDIRHVRPPWVPPLWLMLVAGALGNFSVTGTVWGMLGGAVAGLLLWAGWALVIGLCWAAKDERDPEDRY